MSGAREAVVRAAAALFDASGADGVTVSAVARASRTSVGSIYHHFGSKDGILAAVFAERIAAYRERMSRALQEPTMRGVVRACVLAHVAWVTENPEQARAIAALRREASGDVEGRLVREDTRAFLRPFLARWDAAVQKKEVRPVPHALVPMIVLAPAHELCRHWLAGRELGAPPTAFAEELADAAWRAVRRA